MLIVITQGTRLSTAALSISARKLDTLPPLPFPRHNSPSRARAEDPSTALIQRIPRHTHRSALRYVIAITLDRSIHACTRTRSSTAACSTLISCPRLLYGRATNLIRSRCASLTAISAWKTGMSTAIEGTTAIAEGS